MYNCTYIPVLKNHHLHVVCFAQCQEWRKGRVFSPHLIHSTVFIKKTAQILFRKYDCYWKEKWTGPELLLILFRKYDRYWKEKWETGPESLHDVRAYVVVIVMWRVAANWRVHGHAGQLGEVQQVRLAHLRRQPPTFRNSVADPWNFGRDPWLTNGSGFGSCYFRQWRQQKINIFFFHVFLLITFWRYIYIIFQR